MEATTFSKMLNAKIILKLIKVGRKNSVIYNHKSSNLVHIDPNHTDLNQPIPENLTNNVSINYSSYIFAIENILSLSVNLVHTP